MLKEDEKTHYIFKGPFQKNLPYVLQINEDSSH